ncbi:DUF4380 domain-containing protein [Aeromicrobium piscarium]|uniref:DUF4380 domain-containing protein n=1 Tax=Aeromicrobium piscarium TaxID=2590901 RepID=UPI001C8F1EFF|nr:DUF4380 domain-containing protein [Aeromicrobium piscarium]
MTTAVLPSVSVDRAAGRPEVVWLDNGILRLGVVPAAGGRLLSVALHGHETLWRNADLLDDDLHPRDGHRIEPHDGPMSAWSNYGGDKTWPAPQGWSGPGEWAGPPDPVLDSGPYAWSTDIGVDGAAVLTMTSADDARSGLRLQREIVLRPGESAYELTLRGTNVSDGPVSWSLWNVTQRAADAPGSGGVWVGVAPDDARTVELAIGTGAPSAEVAAPGIVYLAHQDVVGKLGFPTATGWLAHAAGGSTTTQVVPVDEGGEYPDGGSRVEVWMEHPLEQPIAHLGDLLPPARIVEVEVLSPRRTIEPGGQLEISVRCASADGERPVRSVAFAGHWSAPSAQGDGRFAVAFHAYVNGTLYVGDDDQRIGEIAAGQVTEVLVTAALLGRRAVVIRHEDGRRVDAGRLPEGGR